MGGPQNGSGYDSKDKNPCFYQESVVIQPIVSLLTELFLLLDDMKTFFKVNFTIYTHSILYWWSLFELWGM
jgi:hypothetical protein